MKQKNFLLLFVIFLPFLLPACQNTKKAADIQLVTKENFDTIIDGKQIQIFTLRNQSGSVAQMTNFGARWISMWVPDKTGKQTDVVLGFNKIGKYISAGEPYHGAIVGRICGRIDKGKFPMGGTIYNLSNNDLFGTPVKNHLHGGIKGFHKQVWDGKLIINEKGEEGVTFTYLSKDGEEGFPGNLSVEVTYLLTKDNEIKIFYKAVTDKQTLVNLTNHAYFNLNGEGNGNILDHQMKVFAEKYVEADRELIPTGVLKAVKDSPLDYLDYSPMGKGINSDNDQIFKGKGYAVAMVIKEKNSDERLKMVSAYSRESGIMLEVFSDKPSLQLYNAWLFDGKDTGKSGKPYNFSGGFVVEPQGYPDAPNHKNFPSVVLNPGDQYSHTDTYKFSVTNLN